MPFVLVAIGLLMIVVGIRNTQAQLGSLLVSDFTGTGNFFYWIAALFLIGAVGYIDALKEASDLMLTLVILALVLNNRGFFTQFTQQLQSGSAQPPPPGPPVPSVTPTSSSGTGGSGGGSGGLLGGLTGGISSSGGIVNVAAAVVPFL